MPEDYIDLRIPAWRQRELADLLRHMLPRWTELDAHREYDSLIHLLLDQLDS